METIFIPCTEDKDSEIIIKPCGETSDLFVCVNKEYIILRKGENSRDFSHE